MHTGNFLRAITVLLLIALIITAVLLYMSDSQERAEEETAVCTGEPILNDLGVAEYCNDPNCPGHNTAK